MVDQKGFSPYFSSGVFYQYLNITLNKNLPKFKWTRFVLVQENTTYHLNLCKHSKRMLKKNNLETSF